MGEPRALTCRQCGNTYTVTHKRRSYYCGPTCRSRWKETLRGSRAGRTHKRTCQWCGQQFSTTWGGATACSTQCRSSLRRQGQSCPIPWKQCPTCNDWMVARRRTYCSEFCLRVALGYRTLASSIEYGDCQNCGACFIRRAGQAGDYCSHRCAKRTRNRNRRHIERSTAKTGERITLAGLGDRDGWRCHLCGQAVTRKTGNKPGSPSMDHLIPLSQGGEHTWHNVALAHRDCNARRGTAGSVQLRLTA